MGFLEQWTADTQRKADEHAARWLAQHRERARTGQLTLMDRWAAHAQRRADEHAAQWAQRQHEKALSGRMTFMDRWAVRAQRKGDDSAARWQELSPILQVLNSGPVNGPDGSEARIYLDPTGACWATNVRFSVGGGLGGAGLPGLLLMAALTAAVLIALMINLLVFHGSSTVHVHTNTDQGNIHVRMPTQMAAYRAAGELVPRFQAEGPAALESWREDVSTRAHELAAKSIAARR